MTLLHLITRQYFKDISQTNQFNHMDLTVKEMDSGNNISITLRHATRFIGYNLRTVIKLICLGRSRGVRLNQGVSRCLTDHCFVE